MGGQALVEGVMIRSPHYISAAVRKKDGSIAVKKERFRSLIERIRILKLPILRGVVNLFEMLAYGMKMLDYSIQVSFAEEGEEMPAPPSKTIHKVLAVAGFILNILISFGLAILIFKLLPLFLTTQLEKLIPALAKHYILFNAMDGIIRILLFFGYIFVLRIFPSIARVFQYHGAEHQAVFVYEKGLELTCENVAKESPRHPRCGTSFIMIVLIISIIIFTFVPRDPDFWMNFLKRISVLPLIAGVGYEILKWSGKHRDNAFVHVLSLPGLATQYITTQKPDQDQIEIAIAAVNAALEAEIAHSKSN